MTPDAEDARDKAIAATEGFVSPGFGDSIFRAALRYAYEDAARACEALNARYADGDAGTQDCADDIRTRAKYQLAP